MTACWVILYNHACVYITLSAEGTFVYHNLLLCIYYSKEENVSMDQYLK